MAASEPMDETTSVEREFRDVFAEADVVEAFIHLHGQTHSFRECFAPSELAEAVEYVERMLDAKFEGGAPEGKWKLVPDEDGIMYWPGDPFIGDSDVGTAPETKGYVLARPFRESADAALAAQPTNTQIYRA